MTGLGGHLVDYLSLRRSLGYKLERAGLLLAQFVAHLDEAGVETFSVADAVEWATLPAAGSRWWWKQRLSVVRGFAVYLHSLDPAVEVPPAALLPGGARRATPYLYSDADITALMEAATTLRSPLRVATYQTLIGLLAVTGMRVGEAIRLNRGDVDLATGVITVRHTKFDKSRQLPLHPSTTIALRNYLQTKERLAPSQVTSAMFISPAGTRVLFCNVESTFRLLVARAGLEARSGNCRPRMHDIRHSFAVNAVLSGYQCNHHDVQARLAVISTYLGHVDPKATYWYLTASPELLAIAAARLDAYLGGVR